MLTPRTLHFRRDRLKRCVAAPAAVFHALRKTRMALGTHHDHQRDGGAAVFTIEAATARRRQLIARHAELELRFNDLFRNIAANLDHTLIIRLTSFRRRTNVCRRQSSNVEWRDGVCCDR